MRSLFPTASILSLALLSAFGCGDSVTGGGGSTSSSSTASSTASSSSSKPLVCSSAKPAWSGTGANASVPTSTVYVFRNNMWNPSAAGVGTQSMWYQAESCWGIDATHQDLAPKGTVKGYPDMLRGWAIGRAGFQRDCGLPIQVSALTKAKIRWKMEAPTSGRTWALWDIYFHDTATPGAGVATMNLMIQQRIVDSDGWMQQDSGTWPKQTLGGYTFREKLETGTTVSSSRNRVQLYIDQVSGSVLGADDMTLDLKTVIDHYVTQGSIKSTDYLTSIQAGWEIVSGGTYKTDDFWTALQNEPDGT